MQRQIDLRKHDLLVGADGFNTNLVWEDGAQERSGRTETALQWRLAAVFCKLWTSFTSFDAQISLLGGR